MNNFLSDPLLAQVHYVVCYLPEDKLQSVIQLMQQHNLSVTSLRSHLVQLLPKSSWRQGMADLLDRWLASQSPPPFSTLAAMLAAAAYSQQQFQQKLSLEVVWTGPLPSGSYFRRTDQALLQIIREAQRTLTIVSFAVYGIPEIVDALNQAILRGVAIRLVFEMPEMGDKIAYSALASLDQALLDRSELMVWARHKRLINSDGKMGSLHAKFAIVDSQKLFISSANLTSYAMLLNMEMGVLIHSSKFALEVENHMNRLISDGYLVKYLD